MLGEKIFASRKKEQERVDKRINEAGQRAVLLCNSPFKVSQLKQPVICFM